MSSAPSSELRTRFPEYIEAGLRGRAAAPTVLAVQSRHLVDRI